MKHRCELRFRSHRAFTYRCMHRCRAFPFALAGLFLSDDANESRRQRSNGTPYGRHTSPPFANSITSLQRQPHLPVA